MYPDARPNFFREGVVAVNFGSHSDLTQLPADREEIKRDWSAHEPDAAPGRVGMTATQLHRFAHELEVGDLVVTPVRRGRRLSIGITEGPYEWSTDTPLFRHRRRVRWLVHEVDRTTLSSEAHRELSLRPTVYRLCRAPAELLQYLRRA
jgi:predicted Mrr-cat superfamily restriction endonuclease